MVVKNEDGQSVIEFLLMLPMLLGMTMILVKLNTAIQISIVNQQYARAQALFLAFNSAYYPSIGKREQRLVPYGVNQLVVGVSDNSDGGGQGTYVPKATVQLIARNKNAQASNAPKTEPATRAFVRIRDTVTLCTPTFTMKTANGLEPILRLQGGQGGYTPVGESKLSQGITFNNICGSPMKYE